MGKKALLFIHVLLLALAFASSGSHAHASADGKAYTSAISCDPGLHSTHSGFGDESALPGAEPPQLPLLRYVPLFPGLSVETIRTLVSTPYARAPPSSISV